MTRMLNRADLAEFTGKSLPTVDRWVSLGCPVVKRGGRGSEWQFDSAAVIDWFVGWKLEQAQGTESADLEELRRRKLQAETLTIEVELQKTLRKLAPVALMQRAMTSCAVLIQQNMLNLPGRTVSQLVGETDERRIKEVLSSEIRAMLTDASQMSQDEFAALVASLDDADEDDFSKEAAQ